MHNSEIEKHAEAIAEIMNAIADQTNLLAVKTEAVVHSVREAERGMAQVAVDFKKLTHH